MKETICHFGPKDSIFGIWTTPDPDRAIAGAPVALILNAGIVHRVGPFRLHVTLARMLAQQGFSTLRIDLSGLGDSAPRTGRIESDNRAEQDVADAMNYLQESTGTDSFVLIGLCSGAYNAHMVSVKDSRITGAVFMDGIVFRTSGYFFRHHFGRLFRLRFWRNAIKRRWYGTQARKSEAAGESLAAEEFFGDDLSQDKAVNDLKCLLNRGVQMLFLYTDGYDDICGRAQFKEMYGLRPDNGQLQVEYFPKSEHTFRLIENREKACSRISTWFCDRFSRVVETVGA